MARETAGRGRTGAPGKDLGAAACDPHAVARKIIEQTEHPDFGTIPSIRFPPIMSATLATTRRRAPMLGEHTDALLSEFGYSTEKIRELHESDAVNMVRKRHLKACNRRPATPGDLD